jgi:hypothetical protein
MLFTKPILLKKRRPLSLSCPDISSFTHKIQSGSFIQYKYNEPLVVTQFLWQWVQSCFLTINLCGGLLHHSQPQYVIMTWLPSYNKDLTGSSSKQTLRFLLEYFMLLCLSSTTVLFLRKIHGTWSSFTAQQIFSYYKFRFLTPLLLWKTVIRQMIIGKGLFALAQVIKIPLIHSFGVPCGLLLLPPWEMWATKWIPFQNWNDLHQVRSLLAKFCQPLRTKRNSVAWTVASDCERRARWIGVFFFSIG